MKIIYNTKTRRLIIKTGTVTYKAIAKDNKDNIEDWLLRGEVQNDN